MPSDTEISTMEIFLEVLKPVVEITEAIGSEKSVTISTIRPLLYKLLSKELVEDPSDKPLTKTLKCVMLTDLKDRYDSKEDLLNKACLLDPRCKALSFLPQTVKNNIINMVEEEALEIAMTPEPSPEADVEVQPPLVDPPVKKKKGLMSLLEDVIQSAPSDSTASDSTQKKEDIKNEISNYLCLGVKSSESPLQWWLDHG